MTYSPSVQPHHDELVAQGREALMAGDKARAQSLLSAAVELDPRSEEAWMWLSGTYTAPEAMAHCLQQVLAINPGNQQAQDGLRWLEETHGFPVAAQAETRPDAPQAPAPVAFRPPREADHTIAVLLEAALHPLAVGMFLGLLRMVTWLRPSTLVLLRTDAGPLGIGSSFGVAIGSALTHGIALLVVSFAVSLQLSRLRAHDRGDRFDSLVRVGRIWIPGYLWAGALALATAGLGLSPGPWRVVSGLCWLLLLMSGGLIARRLWRLLDHVGVPYTTRLADGGRLVLTLLVGALLGLGLAGIATAAMLG